MSKSLHHQVIARAREIITDPERWTQGELAVSNMGTPVEPGDDVAARFCAVGALARAASDLTQNVFAARVLTNDVHLTLLSFAQISASVTLASINDARHGQPAVLKLFDDYLKANSA